MKSRTLVLQPALEGTRIPPLSTVFSRIHCDVCRSSSRGPLDTAQHRPLPLPPPRLAYSARRLEALVSPAALLTEHGVACLADAVCALLQGRPPDHLLRLISGQSRVISGHLGSSGRPPDYLLRVDAELEPAQVGHEPCSRERRGEMGRGRVFPR